MNLAIFMPSVELARSIIKTFTFTDRLIKEILSSGMPRYSSILLYLSVLFLLLKGTCLYAESGERVVSEVVWYKADQLFRQDYHRDQFIDTTLTAFQRYDFPLREYDFYASQGNVGHISRMLTFSAADRFGFRLFPQPIYPGYLFSLDEVRYYRPSHVYSELYYVMGSDNEQLFYAKHNQRFHERIYGGLKYQSVNSPGPYSRLNARNANFLLYIDYEPVDNYHVAGSMVINRIFNDESGGLKNRLGFEQDEVRDSVILLQAGSRIREAGFRIQQSYRPGLSGQPSDTLSEAGGAYLGQFRHVFSYMRSGYTFDEPSSPSPAFYQDHIPVDMSSTFDSLLVHTISNKFEWANITGMENGSRPLTFSLYASYDILNIRQPDTLSYGVTDDGYDFLKSSYSQLETGLELESDPGRFLSFSGFANYIIGGYNDRDYRLGGKVLIGEESGRIRFGATALFSEHEAAYMHNRFYSNYVRWDNYFSKSRVLNAGLLLYSDHISLEADYYLLDRPVFLNSSALPEQMDGSLSVFTAGLSADLGSGFIRSRNRMVVQYVDKEFERFPGFISYHSFYAASKLFNGVMLAHAGFDLRYNMPYMPMAYMPVSRMFYHQDGYEGDHTFLVDAFINARISRARLFVKLQNILGLIADNPPVYDIPFYPLPETMFKFGVSWTFFD